MITSCRFVNGMRFIVLGILLFSAISVGAAPGLTYYGRLLDPTGAAVSDTVVHFRVQVRSPLPSDCIMFDEAYTRNMAGSEGLFSLSINGETPSTSNSQGIDFTRIFQNHGSFTFAGGRCTSGTTYSPQVDDGRVMAVYFNIPSKFAGWEALPRSAINYVPLAVQSISVGGFKAEELFRVQDGGGLPVVMTPWSQANYQKLLDLVSNTTISGGLASVGGNAAGFTGSLAGDVTGAQGSTTVAKIQGRSVSSAAPSDGDVLTWNQTATRWEATAPSGGGGGGITSLNSSTQAAHSFSVGTTGTDFGVSTNTGTGVHTFNLPDASASNRGALTSADWTVFNGKLGASLANGSIFIGSAGGVATAQALSGAIAVTNGGVTSYSGTVPLNRGGTGATTKTAAFDALSPVTTKGDLVSFDGTNNIRLAVGTNSHILTANSSTASGLEWRVMTAGDLPSFTANRLIGTSAGGVLQAVSCSLNQVVSFDGSGNMTCATAGSGNVTNGGNSYAGAMTVGTNDTYALNFETNGSTRMSIGSSGNVGIATGAVSPNNTLSLGGGADRTIAMERHTTADTAGANLTIRAGSATAGASLKKGGDLTMSTGMGTGDGESGSIRFHTYSDSYGGNTSDQAVYDLLHLRKHWEGRPQLILSPDYGLDQFAPLAVSFEGTQSYTSTSGARKFIGYPSVPGLLLKNTTGAANTYTFIENEVWSGDGNQQTSYIATVAASGGSTHSPHLTFGVSTGLNSRAERMRLQSDGKLGIGNTAPARLLHVGSSSVTAGTAVADFTTATGTCTMTPATSGSGIACSSDETLKENFEKIQGHSLLERLERLQTYTYNFKLDPGTRRTGFKAQEVQKVAPEFVRKNDDGKLQVYYDAFVPWLTESVKYLYSAINGQGREIELLKSEINLLKAKLDKKELEQELSDVLDKKDQEIRALATENQEFRQRLESLESRYK